MTRGLPDPERGVVLWAARMHRVSCEHGAAPLRRGPGIDAIMDALATYYGRPPDFQLATVQTWAQGGPDPLDSFSIYLVDQPVPHWHYIGYGMSELYDKVGTNREISGVGYEFTFRLRHTDGEQAPPMFPASMMENLAREVVQGGDDYGIGDYVDLNGPILIGDSTSIRAVTVAPDPTLPQIGTPHGSVEFRQMVGITLDELAAQRRWHGSKFLAVLAEHVPLLITDLGRTSLLDNPDLAQRVSQGQRMDGSSTASLSTDRLRMHTASRALRRPARVTLGAHLIPDLADLLPARLGFDRDLWILSPDQALQITAGRYAPLHRHGHHWAIQLTPQQVHALSAALRPRAGRYSVVEIPDFELLVEPTTIRNPDGEVTDVIG